MAACGNAAAASALSTYTPWCRAKDQCPTLAPELLKTSMLCTAEGLNVVNESDVICAYDHELAEAEKAEHAKRRRDRYGYGGRMDMEELSRYISPPPPPPRGHQHGQCGHAVKDLFNASHYASLGAPSWAGSERFAREILGQGGRGRGYGQAMNRMHEDLYDQLRDCLADANVAEASLGLPIALGTLLSNGSVLSYESLTQHVCGSDVTHGWLADSLEKWSGLKFVEDKWSHSGVETFEATGVIVVWLLLLGLCGTGCFCCVKHGHYARMMRWLTDETPVMTSMAETYQTEAKAQAGGDGSSEPKEADVKHGSVV